MRKLPAKGTRDFLPEQFLFRNQIINLITKTYQQAGFQQIETPCIEDINLLCNNQGGENEKMVFKILKRGEKLKQNLHNPDNLADLGLRFDLTLPLCRFYANNQNELPQPAKLIQIGQVWRAERPQQGRFRQFLQCDIDSIGLEAPFAEIDLINTTAKALNNLGLQDFTIHINDRTLLNILLQSCGFLPDFYMEVLISLDKLDKINWNGVEKELIEKQQPEKAIEQLKNIIFQDSQDFDQLCEILKKLKPENLQAIEEIQNNLSLLFKSFINKTQNKFNLLFDPSLVRGMGYYTGLIFEIRTAKTKTSIAGGGRYDKLIGTILKKKEDYLAVGFSIGIERLIPLLDMESLKFKIKNKKLAFLFEPSKNRDMAFLLEQTNQFKNKYDTVNLLPLKKKLSRQIDRLAQEQYTHYLIFTSENSLEHIKVIK